jgi:tetratricopeptide (TPR) repeat protein
MNIVAVAILCAVVGVLVHNLIDFAIFEQGVYTTLWAIIAALIALDFNRNARPRLALKPSPAARTAAVTSALVLIWAYLNYALIPVAASTGKIQQAYKAVSAGRFQQAHDYLAAAAESDRLEAAALNLNGRLYLQYSGETQEKQRDLFEKAQECFLGAIERNKADFKNYEKLSTVYDLLGETQNAYDSCLEATKRYPNSDRLRFQLAKLAEKLGKQDIALEQYRKAVEIEDRYRAQFRTIYPERKEIVSRLGEDKYEFAMERIKTLKKQQKQD